MTKMCLVPGGRIQDHVKQFIANQEENLNILGKKNDSEQPCSSSNKFIFDLITNEHSSDFMNYAVGDLGIYLKNFRTRIHTDHPALFELNSTTLAEGGKVYERVKEMLLIGKFMEEHKMSIMPDIIRAWFNRNHKKITKILMKPPTRLLNSEAERDKVRSILRSRNIQHEPLRLQWHTMSLHANFDAYTRFNKYLEDEKQNILRYSNIIKEKYGKEFTSQVNKLSADIVELENSVSDKYYDFYMLTPTRAAVLALKMMGARLESLGSFSNSPLITYPPFTFSQSPLSQPGAGQNHKLQAVARVYPYHSMRNIATDYVKQVIDKLEHHPNANGHALFDTYWVVVPTVRLTEETFCNGKTIVKCSADNINLNVDQYLLSSQQTIAVILGENTNTKKCYFITCWC